MFKNVKFILSLLLLLSFGSTVAEVRYANGYSYKVTGKVSQLIADEEYIKKFTKAFDKKLKKYKKRRDAPKMSKIEGNKVAYILYDPGKSRGGKPARRTTSIVALNQPIPQAVKELAMAEFGATEDDFKAFPMGFRFKIAERRGKKFAARFYLYRKDKKRDGQLETIDMGEGIMLPMPKRVYKFTSKVKPKIKGTHYTLWGPGEVKSMVAELDKNLKEAGYETEVIIDAEDGSIKFIKDEVDGRIGLTQTMNKEPSVNLVMLVKSSKCQSALNLGSAALYTDALTYKCK